ncbi:MAG: 50S ribosomal protein L18 [Chlorobi bacterium]|nr:50S ribosomal protein L18 [Chlorobiota bacterium]
MGLTKIEKAKRVRRRIRKKISGTAERPRMVVFRSNKDIYVQIVNDDEGHTLAAASSRDKDIAAQSGTKSEKAAMVGEKIAKIALEKGIDKVVFDRGTHIYHGRIKALAEGARKGGLKF